MLVPPEFQNLSAYFHQDMMLINPSFDAGVAVAIAAQDDASRVIVRDFLDELLSGRHDDEEIDQVWRKSRAHIGFTNTRELIIVLGLIRDMIVSPPRQ